MTVTDIKTWTISLAMCAKKIKKFDMGMKVIDTKIVP